MNSYDRIPKSRLRILIVDEEGGIAPLFRGVIAQMGHEICAVATTETEAVSAARRCKPDLIIIDPSFRDRHVKSTLWHKSVTYLFYDRNTIGVRKISDGEVLTEGTLARQAMA